MNNQFDNLFGTKFIATIGCGFSTTLLCWNGKIDGTIYATVIIATVGAFIVGKVVESWNQSDNK